jgi:hypothetical protein
VLDGEAPNKDFFIFLIVSLSGALALAPAKAGNFEDEEFLALPSARPGHPAKPLIIYLFIL